ncbi:hypothetical protein [Brevirhabdus sp.]|uniref:hypothetical protein n=1 Tax=Brevirhabdus sp. TaxID=2004514 RepID=UPI0040591E1F
MIDDLAIVAQLLRSARETGVTDILGPFSGADQWLEKCRAHLPEAKVRHVTLRPPLDETRRKRSNRERDIAGMKVAPLQDQEGGRKPENERSEHDAIAQLLTVVSRLAAK